MGMRTPLRNPSRQAELPTFAAQPRAVVARSNSPHKLQTTNGTGATSIWNAQRSESSRCPAAFLYPSFQACSADACTPCTSDAADSMCAGSETPQYPPTPGMTSLGSATTSTSMLSMHATSQNILLGASSAVGRSAAHSALPDQGLQRGKLETPGLPMFTVYRAC